MRRRRPGLYVFDQDQNLIFWALNLKLDPAIIEIPDTSAESSLRCDARRKRAIPDSLDFSLHKKPRSDSCRFNRFGHTLRQTVPYQECLSNERILSHLRRGVTRFAIPREKLSHSGSKMNNGNAEEIRCTPAWHNNSNARAWDVHE